MLKRKNIVFQIYFCTSFMFFGMIKSQTKTKINITCSNFVVYSYNSYHDNSLKKIVSCVISNSLIVKYPNVQVAKVLNKDQTLSNTSATEGVSVDGAGNMNFLPSGIKENFPKLKVLAVYDSKLIHLDSYDMKQFGSDLVYARFYKTSLTALDGGIFEFNPNLFFINFENNPLKYVDPLLFENFKHMTALIEVDINRSDCINKVLVKNETENFENVDWNAEKCNDDNEKIKNLERINYRVRISVQNYEELLKENRDKIIKEIKENDVIFNVKLSDMETKISQVVTLKDNVVNTKNKMNTLFASLNETRESFQKHLNEQIENVQKQFMESLENQSENTTEMFSYFQSKIEEFKKSTNENFEKYKTDVPEMLYAQEKFKVESNGNLTVLQNAIATKIEELSLNFTEMIENGFNIHSGNQKSLSAEINDEKSENAIIILYIITISSFIIAVSSVSYNYKTLKKLKRLNLADHCLLREIS